MSILSSTQTGKAGMDKLLAEHGLDPKYTTINADGSIDYLGNIVVCMSLNKTAIRVDNVTFISIDMPFKIHKLSGSYQCYNLGVSSLTMMNVPEIITGDFNCGSNNLTNLDGGPKIVGGSYYCHNNNLETLEHGPELVGKAFNCNDNMLTTLEGLPLRRCIAVHCDNCRLHTLEGLPECEIIFCEHNGLISLKGCKEGVTNINCICNNIKSLAHLPSTINSIICSYNCIMSFKHVPKTIKTIMCNHNYYTISIKDTRKYVSAQTNIISDSISNRTTSY